MNWPSTSKRASLADAIPTDIFIEILEHLSPHDLASVARTSQEARALAEPILYHHLDLRQKQYGHPRTPFVATVLCTLLIRPELTKHVRHVTLDSWYVRGVSWTDRVAATSALNTSPLFEPCRDILVKTGLLDAKRWHRLLMENDLVAMIILFFLSTPKLQSISLVADFAQDISILGRLIRSDIRQAKKSSQRRLFCSLRKLIHAIVLAPPDLRNESDTTDLLTYLHIPSLEELSTGFGYHEILAWPEDELPIAQNLRTLTLKHVRESVLVELLQVMPQLKSLTWKQCYHRSLELGRAAPFIDLDKLAYAILQVSRTLERLNIRACSHALNPWELTQPYLPLRIEGSLSGLKTLSALRHLEVPLFLLPRARGHHRDIDSVFPATVRKLVLTAALSGHAEYDLDDEAILVSLDNWLSNPEHIRPALIHVCPFALPDTSKWKDRLIQLEISSGVSLACAPVKSAAREWLPWRDAYNSSNRLE